MDKIKEFFRKAISAIKENAEGVVKNYPYTTGLVYLLGMGTTLLVQWLF